MPTRRDLFLELAKFGITGSLPPLDAIELNETARPGDGIFWSGFFDPDRAVLNVERLSVHRVDAERPTKFHSVPGTMIHGRIRVDLRLRPTDGGFIFWKLPPTQLRGNLEINAWPFELTLPSFDITRMRSGVDDDGYFEDVRIRGDHALLVQDERSTA